MMRILKWFLTALFFSLPFNGYAIAPGVPGCEPESKFIKDPNTGVDPAFCAKWNPDFVFKGNLCCGKVPYKYKRRGIRCSPKRSKRSFCDERTNSQVQYTKRVRQGEIQDILSFLKPRFNQNGSQATCSPTDGFLAYGRPVLPTNLNSLKLRRPGRCVNYGTDRMVAMIESLGQAVQKKYAQSDFRDPHLLVGDISAPRGGCLAGRGGRKGHLSHQTGQDADLGFLYFTKKQASPAQYTRRFQVEHNWWLLKQLFNNDFACVKIVLLDRRHIRKLNRHIRKIENQNPKHPDVKLWEKMKNFVQHVRYHRDHYHIRIDESVKMNQCPSKISFNDA